MKRIWIILLALMPILCINAKPNQQTVVFACDIHCQKCCDKLTAQLSAVKGVESIECDLAAKTVTVRYDPRKTDIPSLLSVFEAAGKPAVVTDGPTKTHKKPSQEAPKPAETDANTGASQPY